MPCAEGKRRLMENAASRDVVPAAAAAKSPPSSTGVQAADEPARHPYFRTLAFLSVLAIAVAMNLSASPFLSSDLWMRQTRCADSIRRQGTARTGDFLDSQPHLEEDRNRNYELLVLVIAGDFVDGHFSRPYQLFRNIWLQVSETCKKRGLPIRIYLMTMDPNVQAVTVDGPDNNLIKVPGNSSDFFIPGILEMTLTSMEHIRREELPGHRHNKTLRTNLSSFWRFDRYLQYIQANLASTRIYHGYTQKNVGFPYVNGASILISHDVETLLLENRDKVDFSIADDVAIGKILKEMEIKAQNGKLFLDYVNKQNLPTISEATDDHYHFRLKENSQNSKREQDIILMSLLFFRYYGSDPINETVVSSRASIPKPSNVKVIGSTSLKKLVQDMKSKKGVG